MVNFATKVRQAIWLALDHDVLNTAKAAAYSGILMLFPTMVVVTTLLALVPEGTTLMGEIRITFVHFLPSDTMSLLSAAMQTHKLESAQVLFSAFFLSIFAALGMMLSLMEGFRRAYRLSRSSGVSGNGASARFCWCQRACPAGSGHNGACIRHEIESWMIHNSVHELRHAVLFFWRMVRWAVAMPTSVTVLGALYHFGTKRGNTGHWSPRAQSLPHSFGSLPRWPLDGMSLESLTTPDFTVHSALALPLWCGSISPLSAHCWVRN